LSDEWRRIWGECEGLLCEKEVSSVAKGGKVGGVEGKSWNIVDFKNYFSFFLSLAFAFWISRMGMAADWSNQCGKDMPIYFRK
jgi:hypothetical protein